MKRTRQWHLWIGLISSFFIFIQAATGLIMSEPWIVGQTGKEKQMMPNGQNLSSDTEQNNGTTNNSNTKNANTTKIASNNGSANSTNNRQNSQNQNGNLQPPNGQEGFSGRGGEQSGVMGFIKGLHEGRIGSVNLKIYIDLLAICLMILTATGIVLSFKVLKAQTKRNKKLKMASNLE